MIPSKSNNVSRRSKPRSESRRSSILKPCKPRQPLQNVKLDSSSSNENSPATPKVKRRVSFAEKKHIKEFSASSEQGTVWVNTYEEHDSIFKESFIVDQNTKTESKENVPEYTSENGNTYVNFENSSSYPNSSNLVSNCLCEPLTKTNEEDNNVSCNMDLTNQFEVEKIVLPDAYFVSNISKNATSNGIVEYSDTDEEYIELSDKQSQFELTSNATSNRIIIYKDSNEEDHTSNIDNKYCCKSYSNNVNTKLDNICIQDLSMELTTVIPTSLHLFVEEEKDVQKDNMLHPDNLNTNYTIKYNNISMEMTQPILMSVKPTSFYSGIFEQISTIAQNHENIEYSAANNNTFLTNSQSNIVSKNIVSEQMLDANTVNSMVLPQSFTTGTKMCCANNITFNTSMEMTNVIPSRTYERNIPHSYNENGVKGNNLRENQNDKTEFFNDGVMEMTRSINVLPSNVYDKENLKVDEPIFKDDKTMIFHDISMEMTKTVSARNRQEITDAITCKSSSEENVCERKDANSICFNERTRLLQKSMEITEAVPVSLYHEGTFNTAHVVQSAKKDTPEKNTTDRTEFLNNGSTKIMESINVLSSNIYDNENLRMNEPVSRDDRTIFHNISMEMTKTVSARNRQEITDAITCKPLSEENACGEKNTNNSTCFNERTRLLHKSMEITEAVPVSLYHEKTFNTAQVAQSAKKDTPGKNTTDRTEFLNNGLTKMMESINVLSSNIYDNENLKTNEPVSRNDRTRFFHNTSVGMTKAASKRNRQEITDTITCKSLSEENVSGRKDANNSTYFNEGTRLLHKSMEITEAVPISSYHDRTFNTTFAAQSTSLSQTISKMHSPAKTSAESVLQTDAAANKAIENITMEIATLSPTLHQIQDVALNETENIIVSKGNASQHLTTNNITQTAKTSLCQILPTYLPIENSVESACQTDAAVNNTTQNISMEIIAAIPLILHLTEDMTVNDDKLIVSEGNEFQHRTTNNLTKSRKNVTKETYIISRKPVEAANMNNELSNVFITPSSSGNPDHSLSAILQNVSSRKRISDENGKTSPKRVRSSFMESQTSQENNVHLSLKMNDHCVNDTEHNEHFVKDTIDHTQIPESNLEDSLNKSSECSFLRKSLPYLSQNSSAELQSIKSPPFICLDSEEDNSIHGALCKNECQSLTIDDVVLVNKYNSYNQLTANDITESECLTESKRNATEDYENFTISREKEESINIENNQTEDCYKNTIANKTEDVDNLNTKNISRINGKDGKTATLPIIKKTEVIHEEKYTQKRINDNAKLWNNVEKKDQYSDVEKRLDAAQCNDHFKRTEVVIEEQVDPEEHCKENLNDEIKLQSIEQKQKYTEEKFEAEQCVSALEDKSLTEQDPFLSLLQRLETHAKREDCIWNVYHKNYDKRMIVFGFMSNSLLIVMFLCDDLNYSEENLNKKVKIISRISDDACVLIRIVHKLILEKVNAEILTNLCTIHEDVFSMLDFVSQDVKLAMDFMFDLKHLDDLNLMEIAHNEISFVSRSKRMGVILRVTIKVKCFDKLTSNDINVCCLLGTIRERDVKNLIRNVKKDYKFLRRYMNDVRDYVDIMEGTFK